MTTVGGYIPSPSDSHRKPGPQQPGNYPVAVGPAYMHYGEQPGWVYNPYTDQYQPDPRSAKELALEQGLIEPEPTPPSLVEQITPVALGAGALYAGKELGKRVPGALGGLFDSGAPAVSETGAALSQSALTPGSAIIGPANAPGVASGGTGLLTQGNVGPIADGAQYAENITGAEGGMYGLSPVATGAAGAGLLALGGMGVADAYESGSEFKGALSGATAGAGASMLSSAVGLGALGPWGWGVGLAVGLGAGLLGGRETGKEKLQKRISRLQDEGVNVPEPMLRGLQEYGKTKGELVERETQLREQGEWGNPFFAKSRDERDLTGYDTFLAIPHFEEFGNEYNDLGMAKQYAFNDRLLNEGLLRESRGQFEYTNKDRVNEIYSEIKESGDVFKLPTAEEALSNRLSARSKEEEEEEEPVNLVTTPTIPA